MPVANFPEYSRQLSDAIMDIVGNGQARITDLQVDQRSIQRGYITGILIFEDESALHFREYIDTTRTMPRIMYAYHYQDARRRSSFAMTMRFIAQHFHNKNISTPLPVSMLDQCQHS